MISIWWALLRFLRVVFIPPKFTELEEHLIRQTTHLESELNRERERNLELIRELISPIQVPMPEPRGPHTLESPIAKETAERKRLENASKARWQEHIARQEARAAELMQLDETRAKDARNGNEANGQPS